MVVHLHGARSTEESDGYPEAWHLPVARNTPERYATVGPTQRPGKAALPIWQVGSDGGFLPRPVPLEQLLTANGQRIDSIVDFADVPVGTELHLIPMCRAGVCNQQTKAVLQAAPTANPLAPYFPPFTHIVVVYRESHTFDDYLGDCATRFGLAAMALYRARTTSVPCPTSTRLPRPTP
jgi:hypothetical protein